MSSNSAPPGSPILSLREFLAPAGIAAVVRKEDRVAGRGERQRVAGIEGVFGRPARAAVDVDDRRQRPGCAVARQEDEAIELQAVRALPAERAHLGVVVEVRWRPRRSACVTGFQSASDVALNTISGGSPAVSRTAAKPVLSGAGEICAEKLLVPMIASS